jgi:hypothetical protein
MRQDPRRNAAVIIDQVTLGETDGTLPGWYQSARLFPQIGTRLLSQTITVPAPYWPSPRFLGLREDKQPSEVVWEG